MSDFPTADDLRLIGLTGDEWRAYVRSFEQPYFGVGTYRIPNEWVECTRAEWPVVKEPKNDPSP